MKLSQTKEIDNKKYQISELTVQEIITLINNASFFQQEKQKEEPEKQKEEPEKQKGITDISQISEDLVVNGILSQLDDFNLVKKDLENMMKLCCDFELKDLIPLAPSEIKILIIAFKEVNASFLFVLEKATIPQIIKDLWGNYLMAFSAKLAI